MSFVDQLLALRGGLARRAFTSIAPSYKRARELTEIELRKTPSRTVVLNYLLDVAKRLSRSSRTTYLEIGVRRPAENFAHIRATVKYGVDPGVEVPSAQVDFRMTSDDFFSQLRAGAILPVDTRFDVIFIDGLHLADQVDQDIANALEVVTQHGFVAIHDCNPPTEWHARECFEYHLNPHWNVWNGTAWKAFVKWRSSVRVQSCCIDTDWGIGVLSRGLELGHACLVANPFFEYEALARDRKGMLNLMTFRDFRQLVDAQCPEA